MACGACGKRDVKVRFQGKSCSKCGWVLNRVYKFSPVTKKMVETWVCPNNRCKNVETG